MDDYESLSHTKWECKYHVVFIPKCRRKTLYEELRQALGRGVPRAGASRRRAEIEEGHLMPDHVHMMIVDSAEVRGVAGGRVHQGQERDSPGAGVRRAEAQLRGPAFLGARILRLDGGAGRGGDPRVHPATRSRRISDWIS